MNLERLADDLRRASKYTLFAALVLTAYFLGIRTEIPIELSNQIVLGFWPIVVLGASLLVLILFTLFSLAAVVLKFYADRDDDGGD